jgi:hypothetical protein
MTTCPCVIAAQAGDLTAHRHACYAIDRGCYMNAIVLDLIAMFCSNIQVLYQPKLEDEQ